MKLIVYDYRIAIVELGIVSFPSIREGIRYLVQFVMSLGYGLTLLGEILRSSGMIQLRMVWL